MSKGAFFDAHQRATVEAAMARMIPTDHEPGAREAGTIDFVERYLSGIEFIYAKPDGSGFETLTGKRAEAWRRRVEVLRKIICRGNSRPRRARQRRFRRRIPRAGRGPARRDLIGDSNVGIRRRRRRGAGAATNADRNRAELRAAPSHAYEAGILLGSRFTAATRTAPAGRSLAFPDLRRSWRCSPAATARCLGSPKARSGNIWRRIVANKTKPARADACIIGAGASGATVAKVLDRKRRQGRWPGKGPMARPRDFWRRRTRERQPLQPLAGPAAQSTHDARNRGRHGARGTLLPGAADGRRRHRALAGLAAAVYAERLPSAHDCGRAQGNEPCRLADRL